MTLHIPTSPTMAAAHALDRARLADLRARISRQIEADLDRVDRCLSILDHLSGDADLEPSLCGLTANQFDVRILDRVDFEDEADAYDEPTASEWSGRGAQRFNVGAAA